MAGTQGPAGAQGSTEGVTDPAGVSGGSGQAGCPHAHAKSWARRDVIKGAGRCLGSGALWPLRRKPHKDSIVLESTTAQNLPHTGAV